MLVHLDIRDFAIVDAVSLDLATGMTVLTGETGAGKSILVDAIGLLLGDRADSANVRDGAAQAEVSGQWTLAAEDEAVHWLDEQALADEAEPESIVLRRVISADGRSRAFINGRPVSVGALRELGEMLVEIHGQHAHQLLRKPEHQRRLLDDFGGHDALLAEVAGAARALSEAKRQHEAALGAHATDPKQLEYLRHQVEEIEALQLSEEGLSELEADHQRLAHAESLLSTGGQALAGLNEDEASARTQLSTIHGLLGELCERSEDFREAAELVDQAFIAVDEATTSLRHALDRVEVDPERLNQVEAQISSIHDIARKHHVRAAELPALGERLRGELEAAEAAGGDIARLEAAIEEARQRYRDAAEPLSRARVEAAEALSATVQERLAQLSMPDARLQVALRSAPEERVSAQGSDEVELQFSANPGQSPRALTRVASGGELSRISLALQTALSARAKVGVMIFDEVDVGVGGATAEVVGRMLRGLAERAQVLCVTHLPQVAAQGHQQITIAKAASDGATRVTAQSLTHDQRRDELARMLGGVDVTEKTRELAEQMLAQSAA